MDPDKLDVLKAFMTKEEIHDIMTRMGFVVAKRNPNREPLQWSVQDVERKIIHLGQNAMTVLQRCIQKHD